MNTQFALLHGFGRRPMRMLAVAAVTVIVAFVVVVMVAPERVLLMFTTPDVSFEADRRPKASDYRNRESWWLFPEQEASAADLFLVPGTSNFGGRHWNHGIEDDGSGWRLDNIGIPAMTGPFRACCRRFVPKYRQAGLSAFLDLNDDARRALDLP